MDTLLRDTPAIMQPVLVEIRRFLVSFAVVNTYSMSQAILLQRVSSRRSSQVAVPSLIALGTEELQSGGTAKERFTFGPYTSCILETVFARNMPRSDVM